MKTKSANVKPIFGQILQSPSTKGGYIDGTIKYFKIIRRKSLQNTVKFPNPGMLVKFFY